MKLKTILIILIFISILLFVTGCYDSQNLETFAYVVALGIDKEENDAIKLTLQIAVPSSSSESSSSSQSSSSTILDVKCSTVDDGISLINSYISKQLNFSHCKAVVISEELATEGVSEYVYGLINNVQIRPDCYFIISRCDAYYFLDNAKPTLESVSARYYEFILNSSEYTAYTEAVYLVEFYQKILDSTTQTIAVLGGVNTPQTQENYSSANSLNNTYKANQTPLETSNNLENMGLAIFVDDKLVGELNNIETLCHMIVSNNLKNATINVPNPYDPSSDISIDISLANKTDNYVSLVNNYPYITCDVSVTGYILNLDKTIDLTKNEVIEALNSTISSYLEYSITSYLYKTSKDFHADIDSFGSHAISKYPTMDKWLASDWLNNYKNSFFTVNVSANIVSSQLFNKF